MALGGEVSFALGYKYPQKAAQGSEKLISNVFVPAHASFVLKTGAGVVAEVLQEECVENRKGMVIFIGSGDPLV